MLGDVRVAIRTLDSQMVQDELGQTAIEMTVALVNVSDQTLLIPRPFALEHAFEPGARAAGGSGRIDEPGRGVGLGNRTGPDTTRPLDVENAGMVRRPGTTTVAAAGLVFVLSDSRNGRFVPHASGWRRLAGTGRA